MKSVVQIQRQGKMKDVRCQHNLEMSSFSPSRNIRFTSLGSSQFYAGLATCDDARDASASA